MSEYIEMVPVATLLGIQQGNLEPRLDKVEALAESMRQQGYVGAPVEMMYYAADRTVMLYDGNHRVPAAARAGLTEVPATVRSLPHAGMGTPVIGIDGDVARRLRPSQVLPVTDPDYQQRVVTDDDLIDWMTERFHDALSEAEAEAEAGAR